MDEEIIGHPQQQQLFRLPECSEGQALTYQRSEGMSCIDVSVGLEADYMIIGMLFGVFAIAVGMLLGKLIAR